MDKKDIKLGDIERILFGEAPPEFLLEVLIRTLVVFLALLVFLRLIGKRMGGVLTISELAVMLTLGAILSVPMQMPDRGILQGIVILIFVLLVQRGLNLLEFKHKKVEKLTQGDITVLVEDGMLNLKNMKRSRISKQQVFSELRKNEIYNLGTVKRMYHEACGLFSIYRYDEERPGLSVFPPADASKYDSMQKNGQSDLMTCCLCGYTKSDPDEADHCKSCDGNEWAKAII
ncbi:DUF421 domain-containing protein [Desertivirga xinjiangensis]|uniref:DUF421 domain-containing protein n=1 Tax=Desertivirga xinjiangensis TaxID=539206 RepID=UPI00210C1B03|nr:YetF domain-containing protein [Pedobacter xinjiangensis]